MSEFAYLTTTGHRTGRSHTIEIWYAEHRGVRYLLSGGGQQAHWVRNLTADPRVRIRIGGPRQLEDGLAGTRPATARLVDDPTEDGRARRLLAAKYQDWSAGQQLSEWARTALVVALLPGDEESATHLGPQVD